MRGSRPPTACHGSFDLALYRRASGLSREWTLRHAIRQFIPIIRRSFRPHGLVPAKCYPEEAAANVPHSCEFLWDESRVTESTVAVVSPLAGDQPTGASDEPEVMSGSSSIRDENFSTNGKPLPSKSVIRPAFFPGRADP